MTAQLHTLRPDTAAQCGNCGAASWLLRFDGTAYCVHCSTRANTVRWRIVSEAQPGDAWPPEPTPPQGPSAA